MTVIKGTHFELVDDPQDASFEVTKGEDKGKTVNGKLMHVKVHGTIAIKAYNANADAVDRLKLEAGDRISATFSGTPKVQVR